MFEGYDGQTAGNAQTPDVGENSCAGTPKPKTAKKTRAATLPIIANLEKSSDAKSWV
jgi:hypothetical protein